MAGDRFSKYGPFGQKEIFFPEGEYARRVREVRARLEKAGIDSLITFNPSNIAYLCGHFSSNLHDFQCLVVPQEHDPVMVLWYFELARFHASSTGAVAEAYDTGEDPISFLTDVLHRRGLTKGRIGLDEGQASIAPGVLRKIGEALPEGSTKRVSGLVEQCRLVKSELEVEKLRQAARLTGIGVRAAFESIGEGRRDFDAAADSTRALIAAGSHFMAVQPYICGGWRGGAPHSTATGHVFERGDSVFIEIGANVDRYTAPIMRTAAVGEVRPEVRTVFNIAGDCLDELLSVMAAGVPASKVAERGEAVVSRIPSDVIFHYTFGYPVGINFPPGWLEESNFLLLRDNHEPLQAGMVFHLPMSLRSYGSFGIGLSETVLVTDSGVEVLTDVPRDLPVTT